MLRKTYELQKGPEPISIDEYADRCEQQYRKLLCDDPSEDKVQEFLERHPLLLIGSLTPGLPNARAALSHWLITQPRLPGLPELIPDFMWIAANSLEWYPVLIEIEKPGKKIFKRDGRPFAKFTHARDQLADWRAWFNKPNNTQKFIDYYEIPSRELNKTMGLRTILIYGRRAEFEGNSRLEGKRGALLPGPDDELMSFDRLKVDRSTSYAITVRASGSGKYKAKWVPEIFRHSPRLADTYRHVRGLKAAINSNPEISAERKQFLVQRLSYWKQWATSCERGRIEGEDSE